MSVVIARVCRSGYRFQKVRAKDAYKRDPSTRRPRWCPWTIGWVTRVGFGPALVQPACALPMGHLPFDLWAWTVCPL